MSRERMDAWRHQIWRHIICASYVTYRWVMSHIDEFCHVYTRHLALARCHVRALFLVFSFLLCVCVCVCEREKEEMGGVKAALIWRHVMALHHTATHCNTLQHTTTHCHTLTHTATHYNALKRTAIHCNTLHHAATHYNTLQHTATRCNTPVKQYFGTLQSANNAGICLLLPTHSWREICCPRCVGVVCLCTRACV